MDLIVVESPTKAKTLTRFLDGAYQIEASMGHVADLPENKIGIDTNHDFKPEYVVSGKKKETADRLIKAAKEATNVILATDPDREGEAISWHVANLLTDSKVLKSAPKRIVFHEITKSAIEDALAHPRTLDMNLVDAQQSRRILDRLVGYKLSPLLWQKIRRGLSAGRVQSVAVRLIVEREKEIEAFKAVEYWDVIAKLKVNDSKTVGEFMAKLTKIENSPAQINDSAQAQKIVAELKTQNFEVGEVTTKEMRRSPYAPFTTSTLQQAASNLFGWSAKRTMQVAQNLYEQGLITYHRTDSTNLALEAIAKVRDLIKSEYGEQYLPSEPKLYKTKSKVAQEAHEAIRPTLIAPLEEESEGTDRDQHRLYELIWNRFVACQMTEAIYEQTGIDVKAGIYLLRANGSRQIFDGWQKIIQTSKVKLQSSDEEVEGEQQALPKLTSGQTLDLLELVPGQHFTQPPPRFNEASLIKMLEEYGIGRPSTYAPIISTIQERQYVEKTEKRFSPTSLGVAVNDFLIANFPNILDYQFTAGMENSLDEVANGEKKWVPVIRDFYEPFEKQLAQVSKTAERVKVEVEETDEICPNDGAKLVVRIGKFGKFLACSNFPTCKFTKTFSQKTNIKCPQCGGDVIMKRTRNKKMFYGCSNYPNCKFASWTKPKVDETNTVVIPSVETPSQVS